MLSRLRNSVKTDEITEFEKQLQSSMSADQKVKEETLDADNPVFKDLL